MNIFDILNSISHTKKDLTKERDFEKEYNSFMINRYLSMHPETLMYAEIMDCFTQYIPKEQQFVFLKEILNKEKRYFKYIKKEEKVDKESIKLLTNHFKCNSEKAEDYLKLLTPAQIKAIKKLYIDKKSK